MTTKLPWIKLAEPNGPPLDKHKDVKLLVITEGREQREGYWSSKDNYWHKLYDKWLYIIVTHYCPINTDTSEAVHIDTLKS